MRVCGNGPGVHAEWHVRVKNGMVGEWVLVLDTVQSKGEQLCVIDRLRSHAVYSYRYHFGVLLAWDLYLPPTESIR